jgi:predicted ATPase
MVRLVEAGGSAQSVPPQVTEVVNRRFSTFPAETRRILELVAVIGSEADAQLLAQVAGQPAAGVATHLDAAVAARIVSTSPGPPATVRFGHDLMREAIYQRLPPSERLRHHRAIARAIEHLWAAGSR